MKIDLRDGPLSSTVGIVILPPSKATHCVAYLNENFFVSNGRSPPQKLSKIIIKRNGTCLFSDYKIQCLATKRDSFCAVSC